MTIIVALTEVSFIVAFIGLALALIWVYGSLWVITLEKEERPSNWLYWGWLAIAVIIILIGFGGIMLI